MPFEEEMAITIITKNGLALDTSRPNVMKNSGSVYSRVLGIFFCVLSIDGTVKLFKLGTPLFSPHTCAKDRYLREGWYLF